MKITNLKTGLVVLSMCLLLSTSNVRAMDREEISVPLQTQMEEIYRNIVISNNEKAIELLDKQSDLNIQDKNGNTFLHYAIAKNNMRIFIYLINKNCNLNLNNNVYQTPLFLAIATKNDDALRFLLLKGATINNSLVITACRCDNCLALRLLKHYGADLNFALRDGMTPLHASVIYEASMDLIKFLVENGAKKEAIFKGHTAQSIAISPKTRRPQKDVEYLICLLAPIPFNGQDLYDLGPLPSL